MSNVAVIAEFHPYHNGHHYLFEEAMSLSHADHAIALMSGNFLQRGSIALWDKYTRAEMAVADGFDLCLELPFVYATGSAGDFADGAIAILKSLHAIDYLAFGVEEAEQEVFEQVAEVLTEEPENYQLTLKQALKTGVSYPKARQTAIASICGDSAAALLKTPNNTLALSYLCAIRKLNAHIKPIFIKRISNDYHDTDLQAQISSATAIRTALATGSDVSVLAAQVPTTTYSRMEAPTHTYLSDAMLTPFVQACRLREPELSDICDISPALADKLQHAPYPIDYETLVEQLKTKDITRSRIARALLHLLLGYTESDRQKFIGSGYAYYANILALKKDSSGLIRRLHEISEIPVITKKADFDSVLSAYPATLAGPAHTMWQYDLRATELYNCIYYNHYGVTLPNDYTRKLPVL